MCARPLRVRCRKTKVDPVDHEGSPELLLESSGVGVRLFKRDAKPVADDLGDGLKTVDIKNLAMCDPKGLDALRRECHSAVGIAEYLISVVVYDRPLAFNIEPAMRFVGFKEQVSVYVVAGVERPRRL